MRDIDTIDFELQLVAAFRKAARPVFRTVIGLARVSAARGNCPVMAM